MHVTNVIGDTINLCMIPNGHIRRNSKIPGFLPVQKIKIKDDDDNLQEFIAMIDSGSNTS